MSQRKRDPSVWVCVLLHILLHYDLLLASNATTVTYCDNACRERRVIARRTTREAHQPLYIDYLDYLDDEEDPESNMKMWKAIAESLRQWQERKLRAAANQSEAHSANVHSPSSDLSASKNKKSRKRRDEESVCYGRKEFCFKDKGPFDYLDTLPASPESIGTTFKLYTNANRPESVKETGQFLDYDNATSLLMSHFNASNDVKIIIHGFGSSSRRPWVLNITKALLDLNNFNVINVDWENGAKMPNYVQAAANTQLVGKQIAELIRLINYYSKLTPSHYHLIGFSLGAHVAGFTGMEFRSPNISRITGLDPAAPLFEGYDAGVRLDESDANFVDVIHSNGDGFIRGGLGSYTPMGHVDFYPNGGRVQVGCNSVLMGAITDIISGKWNSLCNHRRAFRFFLDSFKSTCTFRAFSCPSYEEYVRGECFSCGHDGHGCSNMGYFAHQSKARGKMYLITRQGEREPFCGNQFRVRLDSSRDGQSVTWGKVDVQLVNSNGLNETFTLSGESDEVKEGEKMQSLIVAHSELKNVTEVVLSYTKYKGWIYNGKSEWSIDRIEIQDSSGMIKSYCHPRTKLHNTFNLRVPLTYGNCSLKQPLLSETNSGHTIQLAPGMFNGPRGPPSPAASVLTGGQTPGGGQGPFASTAHLSSAASSVPASPLYPGPGPFHSTVLLKPEHKPESVGNGENDIDSGGSSGENAWGVIVRKYGDFFNYDEQLEGGKASTSRAGGVISLSSNASKVDAPDSLTENQIMGPRTTTANEQSTVGQSAADQIGTGSGITSASSSESSMGGEGADQRMKPTPEYSEEGASANNLLRSADIQSQPSSASSPSSRSSRILTVPFASPTTGRGPLTLEQGDTTGGGATRWTRASTYLRNRTAALFNRLWTHSHHPQQQQHSTGPTLQTPLPPHPSPPYSPVPQASHHHPLIEQDGMNILTDYSTLAYYILSNPNNAIVSQQMPIGTSKYSLN